MSKRYRKWVNNRRRILAAPLPQQPLVECGAGFKRKLLRVETSYFVAGAIFERIYGVWGCTESAPIIRWMKGKPLLEIQRNLMRMDAEWEWLSISGDYSARPKGTPQSPLDFDSSGLVHSAHIQPAIAS